MTHEFVTLSAQDPDPAVACDRGVSLVPAAERRLHAPDRHAVVDRRRLARGALLLLVDRHGAARRPPRRRDRPLRGRRRGPARALLSRACGLLASQRRGDRCRSDGRHHLAPLPLHRRSRRRAAVLSRARQPGRLARSTGSRAGFAPLATYTSALNDNLDFEDPRTARRARPPAARPGSPSGRSTRRAPMPSCSGSSRCRSSAFSRNVLYTPIAEAEFLAQNHAVLPYVRPELVLLAEKEDALVGFMFAIPDLLQARRGVPIDTVILKTIAVDPAVARHGSGRRADGSRAAPARETWAFDARSTR